MKQRWLVVWSEAASKRAIESAQKRRGREDAEKALIASRGSHREYMGQSKVERGFRFLKDRQFLASSLFLENEKRIMALLMVMTLCRLVYAALQYRIRKGLLDEERSFPHQKGKPTQRPTGRWVFQNGLCYMSKVCDPAK